MRDENPFFWTDTNVSQGTNIRITIASDTFIRRKKLKTMLNRVMRRLNVPDRILGYDVGKFLMQKVDEMSDEDIDAIIRIIKEEIQLGL